ncbi:MAG TPA: acyl-CoA reductase [Bacteriovoracaceae bacterium]|nr:acyl-CoA reductase [Bacteriovoracaceae bacterium]
MYWFGKKLAENDNWWQTDAAWVSVQKARRDFYKIPLDEIIDLLDSFGKLWQPSSQLVQNALPALLRETGFSQEETLKTITLLPGLLSRESLLTRVNAEFTKKDVLDRFTKTPHFSGKVRAVPRGVVLHVTAGNVFLSSIDSLLMGFLTKNISVLKVSSQNMFFPLYFAEQLEAFDVKKVLADKFSVVHWKGGEKAIESFVKSKVSTIVAWGGEEMIASYATDLPPGIKLLDFGPKISLQVITKEGTRGRSLRSIAEKLVQDIVPWDQAACASPQNLYLENGIDENSFLELVSEAFRSSSPRGPISDDEATEILKEKYRGYYSQLMDGGSLIDGGDHLIHLEKSKILKPSPLNRSLIVKRFDSIEELYTLLAPFSTYLQSCSYLTSEAERVVLLETLALTGLKRFAPLGTITWGMDGAPHDGRFVLRELVSFIGDERRAVDYGESTDETQNSSTLKTFFDGAAHPPGMIFSSGGTTGEPKFVHFSYEEFDFMTDMLAQNFLRQGLRPGMTVANLFVAGNLWSSFMAVEKALEKIGAIQLPIGGMCSPENIFYYLKKFRPEVVMGIPSMLVMNAEFFESKAEKLSVDKVFYAGEALSEIRRDFLRRTWGTRYFGSAGYASVDAGVIGFQCEACGPGEHHLFSDTVSMKILDDEAVVTSLCRDSMPIENYRTGDKVEWIPACSCGRSEPRFKLLGRIDNVIQVWSCRLLLQDIEAALRALDPEVLTFQIILTELREANVVKEKLTLSYETSRQKVDPEALMEKIYGSSRDLKDTITLVEFKKNVQVVAVETGKIPRNARTGKVSVILDQRR